MSGLRLRVRIAGSGPPLLLLMGIGANLDMWHPLIGDLGRRELIAFDAPGTGGSDAPRRPLTMGGHAKLVRKLLDRLGFVQLDVLGLSWGGMLAQKLAITQPERVRRLVLVSTIPGIGALPGRPSAVRAMLTPERYYSREYFLRVAPRLYGGRARTHPEVLSAEAQHRLARPPSLAGYAAQLASVWTYSGLPVLHRLRAPTLVITGDDDPIVPVANGRILARLIPGAELHVVEGGGHLLLLDGTPGIGSTVAAFLDR